MQEKIAVLYHLGGGNLGDEAGLEAVIRNILKRWPNAQVNAITMNPRDTSERFGIPAFPIRSHTWGNGYESRADDPNRPRKNGFRNWLVSTPTPAVRIARALLREIGFLLSAFRTVKRYDQLVIGGGGQLTGRSGPWTFTFGIFMWMWLAKFAGTRRVILNVGAGPLNSRLVKFFSIGSLKAANYVSFRDQRSQDLVKREGFSGTSCVVVDNAYLLDLPRSAKSMVTRAAPVVGIAPMPYPFCDPQEVRSGHQRIYEDCMSKFAAFASSLTKSSYSITLFGNDVGVDPRAVEDLRIMLRDSFQIQLPAYQPDRTLAELLARTEALDYVVTCRFHGVVLAHLLNKPVLALAHHPKVTTIMDDLGLSEYCFDIATFDSNRLLNAFATMVSHSAEIKIKMETSLAVYRTKLKAQYDELFPPAGDES